MHGAQWGRFRRTNVIPDGGDHDAVAHRTVTARVVVVIHAEIMAHFVRHDGGRHGGRRVGAVDRDPAGFVKVAQGADVSPADEAIEVISFDASVLSYRKLEHAKTFTPH